MDKSVQIINIINLYYDIGPKLRSIECCYQKTVKQIGCNEK